MAFKSDDAPKLNQHYFSISTQHEEFIRHFMKDKGMVSASDVVRQALTFFHDRTFPDYIYKETESEKIKKSKMAKDKEIHEMSDEDFIKKNLREPLLVNNKNDIPYIVIHFIGNSLKAYPVKGAKKLFTEAPDFVVHHNSKIESGLTVESQLTPYAKSTLRDIYGIVIE